MMAIFMKICAVKTILYLKGKAIRPGQALGVPGG
jgi:hypothetical protein